MDKDNNQFFDDTSNSTLEKLKKLSSFNSHDEDEDEHTNNDKSDKLLNKMIKSSSIFSFTPSPLSIDAEISPV